jgi:hypothetical protein
VYRVCSTGITQPQIDDKQAVFQPAQVRRRALSAGSENLRKSPKMRRDFRWELSAFPPAKAAF